MTETREHRRTPPILLGIVVTFGATLAAAVLGGYASANAPDFYQKLDQPAWSPPPSVFGPVWTVLYILMAIAAWLIWRSGSPQTMRLMGLFSAQLALNALWSWTFFRWHSGWGSIADICLLWLTIVATTVGFWRIKPAAGVLLLPYLAWVTFAAALNFALWQLNPELLR